MFKSYVLRVFDGLVLLPVVVPCCNLFVEALDRGLSFSPFCIVLSHLGSSGCVALFCLNLRSIQILSLYSVGKVLVRSGLF